MLNGRVSAHTHDDIDWAARLSAMRRLDSLERAAIEPVAARLAADLPAGATVVDVGSGSGGMSAALAATLRRRGGTLVLVDAVDELLVAAREAAADRGGPDVRVETVVADAGSDELGTLVPLADLVWASAVVHHLPDQQAAVDRLAGILRPGGLLAVAEGGLDVRCLPWDLGVGEPGLELRLNAARDAWFERLRATMDDVVRMPYGWTTALGRAGLSDVGSFSYLLDHPAPAGPVVQDFVLERITWLSETVGESLSDADQQAVRRLLDPEDEAFLGTREDLYLLNARTVHYGIRR